MKITKYKDEKDGIKLITPYFKYKKLDKEGKMILLPYGDGRSKQQPDYYRDVRAIFCDIDEILEQIGFYQNYILI